MGTRLLILGGTGTTGKALIGHLSAGWPSVDVTVVSRTITALPGVAKVVTGHFGELARSADFRRGLGAYDAVVHLGDGLGALQQHATDTALAERLIAASQGVALAAREAHVPLFVYVSSIKALCDEDDDRVLVETSEPRPTTLYGRSKLRLEQVVAAAFQGSGTSHVTLRNPVMYSQSKSGSLQRLLQLADTPLPLPLGAVSNKRSLLAVPNFASALAAVVQAGPGRASGTFHVQDGPPLSTTEIVMILRAGLGRRARLFPLGTVVARLARRVPLLAPTARRLYGSLALSDALFRRTFGWAAPLETKAALTQMAELSRHRSAA